MSSFATVDFPAPGGPERRMIRPTWGPFCEACCPARRDGFTVGGVGFDGVVSPCAELGPEVAISSRSSCRSNSTAGD